jgi:hypothetical protein
MAKGEVWVWVDLGGSGWVWVDLGGSAPGHNSTAASPPKPSRTEILEICVAIDVSPLGSSQTE